MHCEPSRGALNAWGEYSALSAAIIAYIRRTRFASATLPRFDCPQHYLGIHLSSRFAAEIMKIAQIRTLILETPVS